MVNGHAEDDKIEKEKMSKDEKWSFDRLPSKQHWFLLDDERVHKGEENKKTNSQVSSWKADKHTNWEAHVPTNWQGTKLVYDRRIGLQNYKMTWHDEKIKKTRWQDDKKTRWQDDIITWSLSNNQPVFEHIPHFSVSENLIYLEDGTMKMDEINGNR